MKYASEVIGLLGAHPGRRFKMRQIINYVGGECSQKQRSVVRTGVWRVLRDLESTGHVQSNRGELGNGAHVDWWWAQSITLGSENHFKTHYNTREHNCAYRF
ncbi:Uncharacterised protein [Alcaligenes faecalis]|nr:hypothetical protein CPY64_07205 [Alcaligenes faecalis]AYZ92317.1 hypothetical protein EGY22_12975 [Alcaligenes faecalis]GAU72433.1 phage protein [Alcaligenes faecalis subsp. faecalis NBRC 13111]CAJ0903226.1 Helix-turn-helix domain-containing protein [Alcaligenes faecalis subsp. faecalis]CUI53224.1 Uncharacterised protein [Alcaligenes faecalis]